MSRTGIAEIDTLSGSGDKQSPTRPNHFLTQVPLDITIVPGSRTIGQGRVVDELIIRFTHSIRMDWLVPRVTPTGRPVAVPVVAIIQFAGDKIPHEHLYWDQASVLVQLGLLDRS